jgi:hypothetical protein
MATAHGRGGILPIPEIGKHPQVIDTTIYKLGAVSKIPALKVGGLVVSRIDIDAPIRIQLSAIADSDGRS